MWELIRANRRHSYYLMIAMSLFVVTVGAVLGGAVGGEAGLLVGAATALIVSVILNLLAWFGADAAALYFSEAREASEEQYRRLNNILNELILAAGLPRPKIYVIDDSTPNAFAVGRSPAKAVVAVTSGLLEKLNRDELSGVVAHELAHIKNGDTLYLTRAAVLVGTVTMLCEFFLRGFRGGRSRGGLALVIIAIIAAVLAPILARLLYFCISRRREYLADASAVEFTRNPEGLASALVKISGETRCVKNADAATAPLYFMNPLGGQSLESVFSTHPPPNKRAAILRALGVGASLNDYERRYRSVDGDEGKRLLQPKTLSEVSAERARKTTRLTPSPYGLDPESLRRTAAETKASKPVGAAKWTPADAEKVAERLKPAVGAMILGGGDEVVSPQVVAAALVGGPLAGGLLLLGCTCGRRLSFEPGTPFVRCPVCGQTLKPPAAEALETEKNRVSPAALNPAAQPAPSSPLRTVATGPTRRLTFEDVRERKKTRFPIFIRESSGRAAAGDWSDEAERRRNERRKLFAEDMGKQRSAEAAAAGNANAAPVCAEPAGDGTRRPTALPANPDPVPEDPGSDGARKALIPKIFNCPCGCVVPLPEHFKGSRARCPQCGNMRIFYRINGK
jgi:heat shock protein HtpX